MNLPDWFPGVRKRRARDAAWARELVHDHSGYTVFAQRAEAVLVERIRQLDGNVSERTTELDPGKDGEQEAYVTLHVTSPEIVIEVYGDQINIVAPEFVRILEQWDFASPSEARERALAELDRAFARSAGS